MGRNLYRQNSFKLCQRIRNSFDLETFSEQNSRLNPRIFTRVSFIENRNRQIASKGAIEQVDSPESGSFVSHLFTVPKSNGQRRPVINLRQLNKHAYNTKFRMEGLGNIRSLLKQGDFLIKIDLQDAYMSVRVAPKSKCLLVLFSMERSTVSK